MPAPLYIIDAFATGPFTGNQAAVCLLSTEIDEALMQQVAAEMNLSETAFLTPRPGRNRYGLRWFTPIAEVEICGHATLGAAHALWSEQHASESEPIVFETLSGELVARKQDGGNIAMDFPSGPCHDFAPAMELLVALGARPKSAQRNSGFVLIELASEADVMAVAPDFAALAAVKDCCRVIITALADDGKSYDFVSRFFAPALGIDEDPVTGSAHCSLCPFWAARLGKSKLIGYQASKRGGIVQVELTEDRVILSGFAHTVVEGTIMAI